MFPLPLSLPVSSRFYLAVPLPSLGSEDPQMDAIQMIKVKVVILAGRPVINTLSRHVACNDNETSKLS